jgi:tRNA A58 N-methylase Trm61
VQVEPVDRVVLDLVGHGVLACQEAALQPEGDVTEAEIKTGRLDVRWRDLKAASSDHSHVHGLEKVLVRQYSVSSPGSEQRARLR